jgi:hypothetical protein
MRYFIAATTAITVHSSPNTALAQDRGMPLKGRYGASITQSCVLTPRGQPPAPGFDPATRALLQNGEAITAFVSGIFTFDQSGGVKMTDGFVSDIFLDQKNVGQTPIASKIPLTCAGAYSISDSTYRMALDCRAQAQNVTITLGTLDLEGFVGPGARALTLGSGTGNILTENVLANGVPVAQRQRVCLFQGSLVKLRDGQNDRAVQQ